MKWPTYHAGIAGIFSAMLFYLPASGIVTGVLVLFVPLVPLFWTGLRFGAYGLSVACVVSFLVSALLTDVSTAAFLLVFLMMPAWLLAWHLLKARLVSSGAIEWLPAGQAFIPLSVYHVTLFVLIVFFAAGQDESLPQLLLKDFSQMAQTAEPEIRRMIEELFLRYSYVFFAAISWIWCVLLYATAVFANFVCVSYGQALRRHVALGQSQPPLYLLVALLIAGVASFISPADRQFLGQSAFLMLLLPYFLFGLSVVHEKTRPWKNRLFWLSGLYVFVFLAPWIPISFITFYGLFLHIRLLAGPKPTGV